MNPLIERAHLFANGKFKIQYLEEVCIELNYVTLCRFRKHFHNCTLIARPIEDMTDEETAKFCRYGYADHPDVYENIRELISEHASGDIFCPYELLMLLDFGVYPFDQGDFKSYVDSHMDGEPKYSPPLVIDYRTLKQEES